VVQKLGHVSDVQGFDPGSQTRNAVTFVKRTAIACHQKLARASELLWHAEGVCFTNVTTLRVDGLLGIFVEACCFRENTGKRTMCHVVQNLLLWKRGEKQQRTALRNE